MCVCMGVWECGSESVTGSPSVCVHKTVIVWQSSVEKMTNSRLYICIYIYSLSLILHNVTIFEKYR